MKFFIDTASVAEIKQAMDWGILDGVTTNPSLVSKEGRRFRELVAEICTICPGPVSAEVVATDAEGMLREARDIRQIADNIVVKIPTIPEGVKAMKQLKAEGIPVNATLIFSAVQALLVAKAGAAYASPFVGRLDDAGHDGMDLVQEIKTIYDHYDFPTEIIVASARGPNHVRDAALIGAHITTMPFAIMQKLFRHPLTDAGLERFLKDWEKVPK